MWNFFARRVRSAVEPPPVDSGRTAPCRLHGEALAEAFRSAIGARSGDRVARAAIEWVCTLSAGLEEGSFVEDSTFDHSSAELVVVLKGVVTGELATRSRVPVTWELGRAGKPELRIRMEMKDASTLIWLDGFQMMPLSGAEELWTQLCNAWTANGVPDPPWSEGDAGMQALTKSSWALWGERKGDFDQTKTWKVIESMAGHSLIRASISLNDLARIIYGSACVTRRRITGLRYSVLVGSRTKPGVSSEEAAAAANEEDDGNLQVTFQTEADGDPCQEALDATKVRVKGEGEG